MKIKMSGKFGIGKYFIIDNSDIDRVRKHSWWSDSFNRPQTDIWDKEKKKSRRVLIGRFIMNPPEGTVVDHINGNTLDNRRNNLRICTQSGNQKNRNNLNKNNTSGFRGITWDKFRNKWVAQLSLNYKHIYLGRYDSIEDARESVKKAICKYHGNFINLKRA